MTINKQALLHAAVKIGAEKWVHIGGGEVLTEEYEVDDLPIADLICECEVVGKSSPNAEFIALANPATVIVLLAELEAAEKRIANLEAREVVLPQRISMEGGAYCTSHARYDEDGDFYYRDDVIESLVAAGIITKVGE